MASFKYPFQWGSVPDSVSVTTVTSVTTTRWTTVGATSKAWTETTTQVRRFERIYEQPKGVFGQNINFVYHISSQFPFFIKTDTQVLITSTITNP